MLTGVVHEANIQDRDGAPGVISYACASFPCIVHVFADGGYAGEKLEEALAKVGGPAIEIVKRPDDAKGFVIVARRWVVERTSHGLIATEDLRKIGKQQSLPPRHGS